MAGETLTIDIPVSNDRVIAGHQNAVLTHERKNIENRRSDTPDESLSRFVYTTSRHRLGGKKFLAAQSRMTREVHIIQQRAESKVRAIEETILAKRDSAIALKVFFGTAETTDEPGGEDESLTAGEAEAYQKHMSYIGALLAHNRGTAASTGAISLFESGSPDDFIAHGTGRVAVGVLQSLGFKADKFAPSDEETPADVTMLDAILPVRSELVATIGREEPPELPTDTVQHLHARYMEHDRDVSLWLKIDWLPLEPSLEG